MNKQLFLPKLVKKANEISVNKSLETKAITHDLIKFSYFCPLNLRFRINKFAYIHKNC